MTSDIEYTCNNCGHEGYNTRAVPDVPELVRYDLACDFDGKHHPDIIEVELGEYVRYDQAAEVMEAKDKEIDRLRKKLRQEFQLGLTTLERAEDAEAELAQIKAQEPVGYLVKYASGVTTYFDAETYNKHGFDIEIVRTLFAAPVDQTAEIERLREALKPFAEKADSRKNNSINSASCFTQSYLQAARAALSGRYPL